MSEELTKRCSKCDVARDISRFQNAQRRKDGTMRHRTVCKDCVNLSRKRGRAAKRAAMLIDARVQKVAPETRMTEKERQRRLRAVEGMW